MLFSNVVAARYSYERSDTHHALSFEATINSNQAFSIWYFAIVTLAVNKRDIWNFLLLIPVHFFSLSSALLPLFSAFYTSQKPHTAREAKTPWQRKARTTQDERELVERRVHAAERRRAIDGGGGGDGGRRVARGRLGVGRRAGRGAVGGVVPHAGAPRRRAEGACLLPPPLCAPSPAVWKFRFRPGKKLLISLDISRGFRSRFFHTFWYMKSSEKMPSFLDVLSRWFVRSACSCLKSSSFISLLRASNLRRTISSWSLRPWFLCPKGFVKAALLWK